MSISVALKVLLTHLQTVQYKTISYITVLGNNMPYGLEITVPDIPHSITVNRMLQENLKSHKTCVMFPGRQWRSPSSARATGRFLQRGGHNKFRFTRRVQYQDVAGCTDSCYFLSELDLPSTDRCLSRGMLQPKLPDVEGQICDSSKQTVW